MDNTSIFGILGSVTIVAMGIVLGGGALESYFDIASIVITVFGATASTIASNTGRNVKNLLAVMKCAFVNDTGDAIENILLLMSFSEKARREGLLSLEDEIEGVEDIFMKDGMQMVVDGAEPSAVKSVMNARLSSLDTRHLSGIRMMEDMGTLAPAFGMIGTLIGLVVMMRSLGGDAAAIGKGMAAALLTTMYGSVLANCIFLPITSKLDKLNSEEILNREIIIEGVLSIQSGDNPKTLQAKLLSYLGQSEIEVFNKRFNQT